MESALQHKGNRIDLLATGLMLLLYVIVFTVGRNNKVSVNEWLRNKRNSIISCTPVKSVNEHKSWPAGDKSANGCMHQTVFAALPGQRRFKRDKMHRC